MLTLSVRCWLNSDISFEAVYCIIADSFFMWNSFCIRTSFRFITSPLPPQTCSFQKSHQKINLSPTQRSNSTSFSYVDKLYFHTTVCNQCNKVLDLYVHFSESVGVFNSSFSTLIQISIRLHTDEHLHVLLIQQIKNTWLCPWTQLSYRIPHTLNLSLSTHDHQVTTDNLLQA